MTRASRTAMTKHSHSQLLGLMQYLEVDFERKNFSNAASKCREIVRRLDQWEHARVARIIPRARRKPERVKEEHGR
jgi:hypothetical protein